MCPINLLLLLQAS